MSDLLKTKAVAWQARPLGELFWISGDQVVPMASSSAEFVHYSIPAWDATGGAAIELGSQIESNKTAIASPSVLVSKLNPRKPRVVAVPTPSARTCCSTEFICYQPKQSDEDLNFWANYFASADFSARLARVAVGSTNSHTRAAPRETLKWFVPEVPSAQQQQIAQIFDILNTAMHGTEAVISKLMAVKQGLLHDLLTRGIAANGELRPSQTEAPHLYKKSQLGWIPQEWEEVSLGEIARRSGGFLQTGPFGSQLHAHEYVLDGIPVIMPQDMVNGELSVDNIARINERKATALSRHRVQTNDLVFSRRGDLSRCVAIEEEHIGWLCGTGCLLARLPAQEINGYWLALVYTQPGVQTQVMGRAVGSTMANLNTSILAEIIIARPPVAEQEEIAQRLKSASKRIRDEKEELGKRRFEKAGLMDDLLTGRVRVTPLLAQTAQQQGNT